MWAITSNLDIAECLARTIHPSRLRVMALNEITGLQRGTKYCEPAT